MLSVLYVDDESALLDVCKIFLEGTGDFKVDTRISAEAALDALAKISFDCIVSDYQMPYMDGIQFLQALRARGDTTPFIIFTGKGREEVAIQALNSGADFYLQKGGEVRAQFVELAHVITQAVRRKTGEEALRRSEQRYRDVVEDQTEFISRFLPDGTHVFVNEAYCRYFNKKREEIFGKKFVPEIPEEDRSRVRQHFASLSPDTPVAMIEHRIVMPDGQMRWQKWSDRAIFDENGQIVEYQSVGRDITDQREAEELVKRSEERYHSLFEGVPVGLYRSTPEGKILDVNLALLHMLGYPDRESLLAISGPDLQVNPGARKEWQARIEKDGIVRDFETQLRKRDETIIWIRHTTKAIHDDSGRKVLYYEGIVEDINEQKQAEENINRKNEELNAAYDQLAAVEKELRKSFFDVADNQKVLAENKATLDSIIGESPIPQFVIDRSHRVTHWNKALAVYSGVTAESVIGTTGHWQAFYEGERPCLADLLMDGTVDRIPGWYEGKFRRSTLIDDAYEAIDFFPRMTGKGKWLYFTAGLIRDPDGEVIGAVETLQDVTELKNTELALRESEGRLVQIIDFLPEATFAIDSNGRVIAWNRAIQELTRVPALEMIGRGNHEYAIPFYGNRRPVLIDRIFESDEGFEKNDYTLIQKERDLLIAETELAMPGGKMRTLWVKASPLYDGNRNKIGAIESIRDITDHKTTEHALEVANKKLTLLTEITRHDIGNKLTVLMGYLDLFRSHPAEPYFSMYVNKINDTVNAINAQIEFTKVYRDLGSMNPSWQNVDTLFKNACSQLDTQSVTVYSEPDGWEIYADPLLEKVFYNVIDDALKYGMTLTEIRRRSYESAEGLVIVIEDNGVGIPQENKERIFTKGFGKNTGLGLFLSREVLSITGITIRETGEPGNGAKFTITVPGGDYRNIS
jgi:PAS domain S-box-containing protein